MTVKSKVSKKSAEETTVTANKEANVATKVKGAVVRRGAKTTVTSEKVKAKAKAVEAEVEEEEEEEEEEVAPTPKVNKRKAKVAEPEPEEEEAVEEEAVEEEAGEEEEEEEEEAPAPKPKAKATKRKLAEPEPEEEEEEEEEEPTPVVKKNAKTKTKVKIERAVKEEEEEEEEEESAHTNEQFRNPVLRNLDPAKLEDAKVLRKIYDEQAGDRRALPKKASVEDLVNEIEGDWLLENKAADEGFASASSEILTVKLVDIDICPLNPRHQLDYLDEGLQALIRKSNGLIKTITVTPATTISSKSKAKYFVVAGNRSFTNYVAVLEEQGVDMTEAEVGVVVRHYDAPTQTERQAQLLAELENDNDATAQFTPIDRLKLINAKLELGRSKASIAREKGWSAAYVSQLTSLNVLPKRILDLVHFSFRSDLLKTKSVKELSKNGVPHTVDVSGNITINGISYNNAMTLAGMVPRERDFQDPAEFQAEFDRLIELIESDEIIEQAINQTEQQFSLSMIEHRPVTRKGKTLKVNSKPADIRDEEEEELEEEETDEETKVTKGKESKAHPIVKLLMTDPAKFVKEIRKKEPKFDFTADSLKIIANKVEEQDPMALKCVRYLVEIGAFDEWVDLS